MKASAVPFGWFCPPPSVEIPYLTAKAMDATTALTFTDDLVYTTTGKRLSDLEREVFVGSWEDKTYEEIYPLNPEYVEKYVGYRLWRKLSSVLGEKVGKKQFRGAIVRASQRMKQQGDAPEMDVFRCPLRVFISHQSQILEDRVVDLLVEAIATAGHIPISVRPPGEREPFAVTPPEWFIQLDESLAQCDAFLLLLSPQTAVSEMAIEELRRARDLYRNPAGRLNIIPIRINCPPDLRLNHDLAGFLNGTPVIHWQAGDRPQRLVHQVLVRLGVVAGEMPHADLKLPGPDLRIQSSDSNPQLIPGPPPPDMDPLSLTQTPLPRPSPVADPELPQGQVRLDSKFYIERVPHDAQCYREITQAGTLIRIKAPRQMGKTSLMSRILHQAREKGYRAVPLNFQHADKVVFANLDKLLQWFCGRVARKLNLPFSPEQHWSDTYGSKDNCTAYFEDVLLPDLDSPLVLALDEVDRVFQYPKIADDFLGLLRAWYEEAGYGDSDRPLWEKLRLVVVHSTEVYIPLDVNQSPFNVGLPVELSEFTPQQMYQLSQRHGLTWTSFEVDQLMNLVGGHPYLVRLALYYFCQGQLTLEQFVATAPTEAGIYGDHLRRHLWNLQQHPDLAIALRQILMNPYPVELDSVLAFKLHSLGLVEFQGNEVQPRFELYRRYFSDRLKHLEF